jgi:hypothetical protein
VLRYRVVIKKEGTVRVPSVTAAQGSKKATAAAGDLEVESIPTTDDMKVQLELPDRPVYVGETIPVKLVWLFRRQPEDQTFTVPMLALDAFTVSTPPVTTKRGLTISAGSKDLQLPYDIDTTTIGGTEFNRVSVTFFAAPRTTGKVEVPPTSVMAALAVGRPDFFGQAPTKLFRASDVPHTLEVKPLPETDRPPSFAGAVGEQFSMEVRTSRSVVQLGEPVELDVTIKSNQRLDALALGKLDGEGGLPKDKFTVPADPPTGTLTDDGKTKLFKVVAQVTGPTREIPALAFSYFDPAKRTYQTIHSEPIALSVKGGSVVAADDVVSSSKRKPSQTSAADDATRVDADLTLSTIAQVEDHPLEGVLLWLVVALLYAVPLGLLGFRSWQLRTATQREEAAEVHAARKRVESLLDRASTSPARELAGPLGAALRDLARVLDRPVDDHGLISRLETEGFAPATADKPLSPDLRSDVAGLLRRWMADARRTSARQRPSTKSTAALSIVAALALPALTAGDARADALADGRAAYQDAMETSGDASARRTAFARAAVALGDAARQYPDRPELLADWGNAALGAGDVATATLAYRRALALDGSNARAHANLAWLRTRMPDAFKIETTAGATDTLLFFHHWPRARRFLVGAIAFAIAVLLLIPWRGGRRRGYAGLAVLPLAIWVTMHLSILLEDRHTDDAVVMDGVVMRAADSAGAPAALAQPLPRGAEVRVLERRDAWTRIQVASGTSGWVPAGAVEKIAR